jgi:hypothetical protein
MFSSTVLRDKSPNQVNVMEVLALAICYFGTVVLQNLLLRKANSYYDKCNCPAKDLVFSEERASVNVPAKTLG